MNLDTTGLSPTQYKMLQVLSDGQDHLKQELADCLSDPLGTDISHHLKAIRKLLRLQGQDIACVLMRRRTGYRWVQLCPPAYESWAYHNASKLKEGLAKLSAPPV
jgi:DNA-binding CsgD family transcriptional regulator